MQNLINSTPNLNNEYLVCEFEELILKHFQELSENVADTLLIAELIGRQSINTEAPSASQLKTLDNLAEEVDSIFNQYKFSMIEELNKSIVKFAIADMNNTIEGK